MALVERVRVYEPGEAEEIVRRAERSRAWGPATINADLKVDPAVRWAEVIEERGERELIEACRERLFRATRTIAAAVAPKTVLAEIQIVRYHAGGQYVDHRDSPAPGVTPRALSLVCYLNDDFSGGETVFSEPPERISPQAGMAAVFPPERLHRAEPVTAGVKYVLTAWYHVPPLGL